MIEKIILKERTKFLNEVSFYDLFSCSINYGKQYFIQFSENISDVVFSDLKYTTFEKNDFRNFYEKEEKLVKLLCSIIEYFGKEVFVVNYVNKWIKDKRISPTLNKLLKQYEVKDTDIILKLSEKKEWEQIAKSIIRYNTFAEFVTISKDIIITPTDHLDIFVSTKNDIDCELEQLLRIHDEFKEYFIFKTLTK